MGEDKPGRQSHDEDLGERAHRLCRQHHHLAALLHGNLLAPGLVRFREDAAPSVRRHAEGAHQIDIGGCDVHPAVAPGQGGGNTRRRGLRRDFADEGESEKNDDAEDPEQAEQRMNEEEEADEDRRPQEIEQHRARAGAEELAEGRHIPVELHRLAAGAARSSIETGRDDRGPDALVEPHPDAPKRGAAQGVEHAADHDGRGDDQGQHRERIGAAAR